MDRVVRQIFPEEPQRARREKQRLSAFLTQPNIVLLGDPGAGKSHTFRALEAAGAGRYVRARAFLAGPVRKTGEVLLIDGLDEGRGGRGDRNTVDALAAKLIKADPAAVRISCRVADWLGNSDLVSLDPFFEGRGGMVVLTLGALTLDERRAVLTENGMSPSEADALLREAEERGLAEFLGNPENLLLLRQAVQSGAWPTTRGDLFGMATQLMLREVNSEHARTGSGVYTGEELRLPAGAVLAARLISDIEAISLADQEGTATIPSYRTLPFFEPEKTIAALGRRVFAGGPASETVDYVHRTTAEYLGAVWLAEAVRAGLPIGRVIALMGVDGHPASELRGLHAWLAVHLPEHAERLIEADPYGVLAYGDAASLTQPLRVRLLRSLGRLSQTDPWFRTGHYPPTIAGLARPDMIDELRAVLRSPDAGLGVRSIVIEATALGVPLPALREDLASVLETGTRPYAERFYSLVALLRFGDDGKETVQHAYATVFGRDLDSLRLRAAVITRLYGNPFGPADVVALLNDIITSEHELDVGVLWELHSDLPFPDLPAILDAVQPPSDDNHTAHRRNAWEVAAFFDRALLRVLEMPIDPGRLLGWLGKRREFTRVYAGSSSEAVRAALSANPERLTGMLAHFLKGIVPGDDQWLKISHFREAVFFEVDFDQFTTAILTAMATEPLGSPRELFFYEAAFSMSYHMKDGSRTFERLYEMGDHRPDLAAIRARMTSLNLPEKYLERMQHRAPGRPDATNDTEPVRRYFAGNAPAIARGEDLNGLVWSAWVYLGLFADVDHAVTSEARLVAILGNDLADIALAGLVSALNRSDVPSLQDVINLAVKRQHMTTWHVYLAGLTERFRRTSSFDGVSDGLLRAMLAFELTNPVPTPEQGVNNRKNFPWNQILLRERPGLVREVYEAVARAKLAVGELHPDGMHQLLTHDAFAASREDVVLGMLRDFPNAHVLQLRAWLMAALQIPSAHAQLLDLADQVLSGAPPVNQPQHDLWLVSAWLLSANRYGVDLQSAAQARREIVFELRDFTGYSRNEPTPGHTPSLGQIEFLVRLVGSLHAPVGYPSHSFWGDRNPWDAAEYVRNLLDALSSNASLESTDSLSRLEADASLEFHRPEIQHALANQRARRREIEFDRPNWPRTVHALDNKHPATISDLHAVLVDHIHDLSQRIRTENTDIYRMFWNVDGHQQLLTPRPEEVCRDDLITLLRQRLAPLGISLEPEGHMAGDRRADISAAMPGKKILCEIKRDYHRDVWTAPDGQLERFYTHDPEARGFGIYIVLWFGDRRPYPIPLPPNGRRPESAADMESMLRKHLRVEIAVRIAVIVLDVTKPD